MQMNSDISFEKSLVTLMDSFIVIIELFFVYTFERNSFHLKQ